MFKGRLHSLDSPCGLKYVEKLAFHSKLKTVQLSGYVITGLRFVIGMI